jgi:hypothetical protein
LKEYEKAIEDSDKAVELNPNHIKALVLQIVARSKLEEQKTTQPLTPTVEEKGLEEQKTTQPPTPTVEEKGVSGFEAIFVIAGILAVAYLLKRRD